MTHDKRAYQAAWRQAHRAEQKAYRAAHREHQKAYMAAWLLTHREHMKALGAAYRATHRDEQRKYFAAHGAVYRANHRNEKRVYDAAYRAANRDKRRAQHSARRAKKRGSGGSHTAMQWREKLELFAHLCLYCGKAKPLTQDHKTPLARGGTDDIDNIVPACASCNSRKGTRTAAEFIGWQNYAKARNAT